MLNNSVNEVELFCFIVVKNLQNAKKNKAKEEFIYPKSRAYYMRIIKIEKILQKLTLLA